MNNADDFYGDELTFKCYLAHNTETVYDIGSPNG